MSNLTDFYFTNEQLSDIIMKDNIIDKWCEVNLSDEQMIDVSVHNNCYFEVGKSPPYFRYLPGIAIFDNINILKGTIEQEHHKCHCPDINFSLCAACGRKMCFGRCPRYSEWERKTLEEEAGKEIPVIPCKPDVEMDPKMKVLLEKVLEGDKTSIEKFVEFIKAPLM